MEILDEPISGLLVLKPKVFADARGHFFESFRDDFFRNAGINAKFVQDNQSLSNKGIVRGLHFQKEPHAQGKLVRVVAGSVLDVAVDIRKSSPTYGKCFSIELSAVNFLSVYIPPGFAHGFATLQDETIFQYKCTDYYHPESEGGILWNSPGLNIDWGFEDPVISDKDGKHPEFAVFDSPFL
jgi:dTDP-4-dehydrorhamnose 3,5-epimerase